MTKIHLAFAYLNLCWNPFGDADLEDIPQLAVAQVEQYISHVQQPGFALQFLGQPGRGKTTHLLALRQYFPQAPYLHFAENAAIPEIPCAPLLFLDETQRLSRSLRKQIFNRKVSYVIGTHLDHSFEFRQAGLEYESVHLSDITTAQLNMIIQRRLEWARRGPGPVPTIPESEIAWLIHKYGDNLAAILARLYDEFQVLKEVGDVRMSAANRI